MQRLCHPGILGSAEDRGKRRARHAQQRNAGGTEQERGPDLGGRTRALVGGDHEPQHQQRGGDRGGADHGGEGFKQQHQDSKYAFGWR
jgi:hypothetical protein